MTVLYVASDQRGAGKTALCAALAKELKHQGKRVAVFKPLSAPTESGPDPDPATFRSLLGQPEPGPSFNSSGRRLTAKLLKDIRAASEKALEGHDILVVEGSSALSENNSAKLAKALDAKVLVVARYQPGLDAAHLAKWRALCGEALLGVVINGRTRHQGTDTATRLLPSMSSEGLVSLGVIPEDRRLLSVTVGLLASHLDGRFVIGEGRADSLVEHFMVGGMGLDSGALYFGTRENKAVIVRGDRPDIQMAALETSTSCMLLTAGIEPIEYVLNEADLEEVPVIVVRSDTMSTMALLNTVLDGVGFDHPAKLDRFGELLREHVDLGAIYKGLDLAA